MVVVVLPFGSTRVSLLRWFRRGLKAHAVSNHSMTAAMKKSDDSIAQMWSLFTFTSPMRGFSASSLPGGDLARRGDHVLFVVVNVLVVT